MTIPKETASALLLPAPREADGGSPVAGKVGDMSHCCPVGQRAGESLHCGSSCNQGRCLRF